MLRVMKPHYRYNARGQLIEHRTVQGYPTTLTYDDWGQLRSLTNAQNETTTYTFSEAGLLMAQSAYRMGQKTVMTMMPPGELV